MLRSSLRDFLHRHLPVAEIVGEAGDAEAAWAGVSRLLPDLVVMDLDLPGVGGAELTRMIHSAYPEMKVLILSAHAEENRVNGALDAGASGYLLKQCSGREFVQACQAALAGDTFLSPCVSTIVVKGYQRQLKGAERGTLTEREIAVLRLIADGSGTKEIAHALQISTKTVETYRSNLMRKLNAGSVAALTKYAIKQGLSDL